MISSMHNRRGFTMIEMMIVTVIIGIMASMAAPQFGKVYDRMKMRAASRDIASDFRLARSMAITDKDQYGMYFDTDHKTITIFKDLVNPSTYTLESSDSIISIDTLPAEFVALGTDCTNDVIAFKPNGSAGFSGGGNVWAMGVSTEAVCISTANVLAATGRLNSHTYLY